MLMVLFIFFFFALNTDHVVSLYSIKNLFVSFYPIRYLFLIDD